MYVHLFFFEYVHSDDIATVNWSRTEFLEKNRLAVSMNDQLVKKPTSGQYTALEASAKTRSMFHEN